MIINELAVNFLKMAILKNGFFVFWRSWRIGDSDGLRSGESLELVGGVECASLKEWPNILSRSVERRREIRWLAVSFEL